MKKLLLIAVMAVMATNVMAQRSMDKLDRGLIAIKTDAGVFCSWRILGEEYYDVTYNIYRDGTKLNAEPLSVSNFVDAAGSTGSKYTVSAVVKGKEGAQCDAAGVWEQNYLEITPDHGSLTSTYIPNDACMADVDGDGELEILMKFDNASWAGESYKKAGHNGEYFIIEVFKLNGKKLWWIDLGPNMADFQNNEQNIVAYDWDQDGKAEALMRASDGTVIHMSDGTEHVIGDRSKNYLAATSSGQWFVHQGNEYLVYMNGETGKPYQVMDYPLKRLEDGETDLEKAWGDGYGHRSTKHFFGAPYLDGRRPSIFLARGIYTRHKMVALDVNPDTHELTERWRWNNNTPGSAWYGQGYHNYSIADVDWDGRDEICFGSMVIDDNGHGLSTTGLGHGDAQHHGDFNPYIHGHEIYACNEDAPDNNYRDATTSKIYYRQTSSNDDGRAMMGNFSNEYPGCLGRSGHDTAISSVTNNHIPNDISFDVNFRIYWDGDLLEETFNGTGTRNSTGRIYKPSTGSTITTLTGSLTNNDTKATPCYQGDILGDWREEVIMRTADNKIRIYSTTMPTEWRNYTLWHDMQYRQAMVWQMCGYNQPPHVSYFLGELEGITQAPPALTMTKRIEVTDGGEIGEVNTPDPHWLLAETRDATVRVQDGCHPYIVTVNTPSWVQGHDSNDHIEYTYYTHTLTGGAFAGDMRLVKQGDGMLVLPKVTQTYTGNTDIWAGTLQFDGTMKSSPVWLNRHTSLVSDGGSFMGGIVADYNATIYPGGKAKVGTMTVSSLNLNFGSRVVFDVISDGSVDKMTVSQLTIEKKDWKNGPQYQTPVFEIVRQGEIPAGKYLLVECAAIVGDVSGVVLEGMDGMKASLLQEDGKIYLDVKTLREASTITWDGGSDGIWDFAKTENFKSNDGNKDIFVTGDIVTFGDDAAKTSVVLNDPVSPKSVVFKNSSKDYTLSGSGSIIGNASLIKEGTGNLTIQNINTFTGGVNINEGRLTVSSLANTDGVAYGALGGVDNTITLSGGTLAVSDNVVSTQPVKLNGIGGIYVLSGKTLTANGKVTSSSESTLQKSGAGTLLLGGSAKYNVLEIAQGTVQGGEINSVHQYPTKIVLNGGTLKDPDNIYSYSTNSANIEVPEGKKATWTLDSRCDYKGKLTGAGTLTVNVTSVRCNMQGDWSEFEGTINFQKQKTGSYDPLIQWNNTKGLGKATVTGVFDNSGKNVAIGTIQGNATLTGAGSYTAGQLSLSVVRGRGNSTNTMITVEGTLSVTDAITVTWTGTAPKLGETITLWKVGRLSASANVTLNLPTLADGLYWDTTDLLKPEGVLRVTDQPTGIQGVSQDRYHDGKIYTLSGVPVENPTKKGIYIKNGKKFTIK
jgi:autotransporter-associated beta strand protein